MKALEDRIRKEAKILGGGVLKVSSFLNHQIDPDFMAEIGSEIARLYADEGVTKILTIEASGIAIAVAAGMAMHVPVLFAKKHRTSNVSGALYRTTVHSFTHNADYTVVVESEYLNSGDRVLIVDDFLANGMAINGLLDIIAQAGAQAVGVAAAVEKGFQGGGKLLRSEGLRVESLAIVENMDENGVVFREQNDR